MRADFGITYDSDALKMIDDLRTWGIQIVGVVITRYEQQPAATVFKNKLERRESESTLTASPKGTRPTWG